MRIWISAAVLSFGLGAAAQAQQADTAPAPEYPGPSVLSRGRGPTVTNPAENVRFRPFLSLTGVYDSGLLTPSVDSSGGLEEKSVPGVEAGFGVYGYRAWKRSVVGLDYRGTYRHYTGNSYYDGTDQALMLAVSHKLSRRVIVSLKEAAGIQNRSFGNTYAYWVVDPVFANLPQDQLFDNRILYLSNMADVTIQKSARVSFNLGGDQMIQRYRSSAFYGVSVTRARADTVYRYSRRGSIGVVYSFDHFSYTKNFGGSDLHTTGIVHSLQLSRNWQWQMQASGVRVETLGAARVLLDPAVAAIIGQTVGVQAVYRVNYLPSMRFTIGRSSRRGSFDIGYQRGINPGNGVYLISSTEGVGASGRYTAARRLSFQGNMDYTSYSSLSITMGRYKGLSAGGGFGYQLARMLHLTGSVHARRYGIENVNTGKPDFNRIFYRAMIGLALAPGDLPLSIW